MRVHCEHCGRFYDDEHRWTLCPHRFLTEPASPLPQVPDDLSNTMRGCLIGILIFLAMLTAVWIVVQL